VALPLLLVGPASGARAASGPHRYLDRSDNWFRGEEAARIAANILSFQSDFGGWPKNLDTTAAPYTGDRKDLKPTFDNDATTDELRFLMRIFNATQEDRYRKAFDRGLHYILNAQYPTGGWPQLSPPPVKTYHRHITFNDNAMVRLMELLREVRSSDRYAFAGAEKRQAARQAFERGLECMVDKEKTLPA
jgi:pectate lyase